MGGAYEVCPCQEEAYCVCNWIDPNDAPRLNRAWFERTEIREGGRLIRRRGHAAGRNRRRRNGRSTSCSTPICSHITARPAGWQSRINAALRKAARL